MNASSRLRIIVLGYIVRGPLGGLAWHHLQYVLGLERLGHDVYFLEDSDDYPACYDPSQDAVGSDPTYGLAFAADAFGRLGLGTRWAYYDAHADKWHGAAIERTRHACETADLVINLSGVNPLREWVACVPGRAFVDTDPAFTQIRHLSDERARKLAEQHTAFFTFGENIPTGLSAVPDDGFPWWSTRQPIVLDAWPVTPGPVNARYTTVMQWDSYPPREYGGRRFGMKSMSFSEFLKLPLCTNSKFELALGSPGAPRDLLTGAGWHVRDPLEITRTPWTYQQYIEGSKAEFSVAKHGYVAIHSGWFSERSAAYLASGRPVLVQDTGFTEWLHADGGVLPFSTLDEALDGIRLIDSDYKRQCRIAREVAAEYFDANLVLPQLIERCTQSVRPGAPCETGRVLHR